MIWLFVACWGLRTLEDGPSACTWSPCVLHWKGYGTFACIMMVMTLYGLWHVVDALGLIKNPSCTCWSLGHYGPWYPSLEIRRDTMMMIDTLNIMLMYGEKVEHILRLRRWLVNKDKVDFEECVTKWKYNAYMARKWRRLTCVIK